MSRYLQKDTPFLAMVFLWLFGISLISEAAKLMSEQDLQGRSSFTAFVLPDHEYAVVSAAVRFERLRKTEETQMSRHLRKATAFLATVFLWLFGSALVSEAIILLSVQVKWSEVVGVYYLV